MRGEFLGVWSETWRGIWLPLIDADDVPRDIFCELYRELANALKEPTGAHAVDSVLNDAVQLREAFERAVVLSGVPIEVAKAKETFDASGATALLGATTRRFVVESALELLVRNAAKAPKLLDKALGELATDPKKKAEAKERAVDRVINDPLASQQVFEALQSDHLLGERAAITFLETAHASLNELAGDGLANRYFNLLSDFIEKFSLRYDLRRPCLICPTLPGIFANLVRSLAALGDMDANVAKRLRDFREAVQDLRYGPSEGRIANCVIKQVMVLEATASAAGFSGTDLAALCKAISDWPHPGVRKSLLDLYGFASDFPGVRHGTPSSGMAREIDMRDMVAMSILLTGFTPYLERRLNTDLIYGGSASAALAPSALPLMGNVPENFNESGEARGFFDRLLDSVLGRRP